MANLYFKILFVLWMHYGGFVMGFGVYDLHIKPRVLPEQGVVFIPGKIISTADTNHLLAAFHTDIPWLNRSANTDPPTPFCHKRVRFENRKARIAFKEVCNQTNNLISTLHSIATQLFELQAYQVREITGSVPGLAYVWDRVRSKRALMSFGATILQWTFGVARDVDVRYLKK